MDDLHTYTILVNGDADPEDINAASPVKLSVDWATERATALSACSDQSGLIGILRHLHGMGYVLISVQVDETC